MSILILNHIDRMLCRSNEISHKIYIAGNSGDLFRVLWFSFASMIASQFSYC